MTDESDDRTSGVEFGDLEDDLESHSYPVTVGELRAEYGDRELDLEEGSQQFGDVLGQMEDEQEFESADGVKEMVLSLVGGNAVGREGYSDRGGTVTGSDVSEGDQP